MHWVNGWPLTQSMIALSSGEAEYYGMVTGGSVAMGFQSLLEEVGVKVKLVLKPAYNTRKITKDAYKEILRKTVPKVCIFPSKILIKFSPFYL